MKSKLLVAVLGSLLIAPLALAHGPETHEPSSMSPGRLVADAEQTIAAEATEAVAALERFSSALSSGELDKAAAELDPGVIILESGGVERSRDEYMSGHAKGDAAFLQAAKMTLKKRNAAASGDLAWVASETSIHAMKDDKMLMIDSTETAVLRKTSEGWKIVHLHWSSRRANAGH